MSVIRYVVKQGLYKEALSVLMWVLSFKTEEQKREHLKMLQQDFLTYEYVTPPASDGNVLFIRSLGREDYAALFGAIFHACSGAPKTYFESFKKSKVKHNAKAAEYIENNIDLEDWIDVRNPIDRQCAFMVLISYCFLLEHYADVKFRAVVAFSDMQPIENLFIQYFRSKGIPTVSAQHGLYIDYGEYKTINAINYMNHAADYFLAWGEKTAELISTYHPKSKIVMCGKPLVFQGKSSTGKSGGRSIMVVLDQAIFENENYAMSRIVLDYARNYGYQLTVRFHPSLKKDSFFRMFPDVVESSDFMDADIVVGHTSTLMFEALAMGKSVVQFKTNIPAIDLPKSLQFNDLSSLEKAMVSPIKPGLSRLYFCALNNDSKKNYADFFTFLLNEGSSKKLNFYSGAKGKQQHPDWYMNMLTNFFENSMATTPQLPIVSALPELNHLIPISSNRLVAIVMPCLASDLPILDFIFGMWSTPSFAPSLAGRKVSLMLVFNQLSSELRHKVRETWEDHPKLALYFNELHVESADLAGDRDLYVKSRSPEAKGEFGNIAGPNFLFQSAMNYAARFDGYVFQMEVDCFPLLPGWIEALDEVIKRACGAWVIGGMYSGDFRINNLIRFHLNGNALYKTGDAKFIDFINNIWIPRLLEISIEKPNVAYDSWYAMEMELSDTKDISNDGSWNLVRRYSSFFYNDPFIINLLKSDSLEKNFEEYFCFYESLGKAPVFLHYAYCKKLAERVLAGEAESLLNLLLPSMKEAGHATRGRTALHENAAISTSPMSIDTLEKGGGGDRLARLGATLSEHNPSPSRCRIFLMSCISELLLRRSSFKNRISSEGDLEKPLALALKYNTDLSISSRFFRISKYYSLEKHL